MPQTGTVVDIGCGTGTLAIAIKRAYPDARVIGIDADAEILERARTKARTGNSNVEFIQANAKTLPLANAEAQRVVSSLFFHHLQPGEKALVLLEALRVLCDGGELHIADWGAPSNMLMRTLFFFRSAVGWFRKHRRPPGRTPADACRSGWRAWHSD